MDFLNFAWLNENNRDDESAETGSFNRGEWRSVHKIKTFLPKIDSTLEDDYFFMALYTKVKCTGIKNDPDVNNHECTRNRMKTMIFELMSKELIY